jgi:hypothetical protein
VLFDEAVGVSEGDLDGGLEEGGGGGQGFIAEVMRGRGAGPMA